MLVPLVALTTSLSIFLSQLDRSNINLSYDYNKFARNYDSLNGGQASDTIGITDLRTLASKVLRVSMRDLRSPGSAVVASVSLTLSAVQNERQNRFSVNSRGHRMLPLDPGSGDCRADVVHQPVVNVIEHFIRWGGSSILINASPDLHSRGIQDPASSHKILDLAGSGIR